MKKVNETSFGSKEITDFVQEQVQKSFIEIVEQEILRLDNLYYEHVEKLTKQCKEEMHQEFAKFLARQKKMALRTANKSVLSILHDKELTNMTVKFKI